MQFVVDWLIFLNYNKYQHMGFKHHKKTMVYFELINIYGKKKKNYKIFFFIKQL